MGLVSLLYVVSALLLLHSAYSAYEYSYLAKHLSTALSSRQHLPLDIKAEAVAGTILAVIAAIAYKADNLKPIKFSEAIVEDELAGKGPYLGLERRTVFQSIAERRKEYSEWAKIQASEKESAKSE